MDPVRRAPSRTRDRRRARGAHLNHRVFERRNAAALLVLLGTAILVRTGVWFVYQLATATDSYAYLPVAKMILHRSLRGYDGIRTPGYPLFMALAGLHFGVMRFLQTVLGIGSSLLLFGAVLRRTGRRLPALVAGLYPTIHLGWLSYESVLLSETLTIFLVVVNLALLVRLSDADDPHRMRVALGLGATWAALAMTRPAFLFGIGILPFVALAFPQRTRVRAAAAMVAPMLVAVLAWSGVNLVHTGAFTPSTLGGMELTNHTGRVMEEAPASDAVLRDIYLKYRAPQIAQYGTYVDTIWPAYHEMLAVTGLRQGELSSRLLRLSVDVIEADPGAYAYTVGRSFLDFWQPDTRWYRSRFRSRGVRRAVLTVLPADLAAVWLVHLAFLFLLGGTIARVLRRRWRGLQPVDLAAPAIVVAGDAFQALAGWGSSKRYGIPFEPLIAFVVAVGVSRWTRRHATRNDPRIDG